MWSRRSRAEDYKSNAIAVQLEQELIKVRTREVQQTLIAPVPGTAQQIALHTEGLAS